MKIIRLPGAVSLSSTPPPRAPTSKNAKKMQRIWSVPSSKRFTWTEFKSNLYNQAGLAWDRLNGNKLFLLPIVVCGGDRALIFA